jgi:hypothetical protein
VSAWIGAVFVACAAVACGALATTGIDAASSSRFSVTSPASSLVDQGLAAAAPASVEAFQEVPAPGIRFVANEAQATTAPWIDSNGRRFQCRLKKVNYAKLPAGSAPLAAAEAFTFDADESTPIRRTSTSWEECCGSSRRRNTRRSR